VKREPTVQGFEKYCARPDERVVHKIHGGVDREEVVQQCTLKFGHHHCGVLKERVAA
jgi:hypothetical protein